jgi:hypothetical protein
VAVTLALPDPAAAISYWLREPAPPDVADPPLHSGEHLDVDVAIVGGGFTGLWTAIALTDTDPALRVAVLVMETVAFGGSGRKCGFCEASLTHGWPTASGTSRRAAARRAGGPRQPARARGVHP